MVLVTKDSTRDGYWSKRQDVKMYSNILGKLSTTALSTSSCCRRAILCPHACWSPSVPQPSFIMIFPPHIFTAIPSIQCQYDRDGVLPVFREMGRIDDDDDIVMTVQDLGYNSHEQSEVSRLKKSGLPVLKAILNRYGMSRLVELCYIWNQYNIHVVKVFFLFLNVLFVLALTPRAVRTCTYMVGSSCQKNLFSWIRCSLVERPCRWNRTPWQW